MIPTNRKRLKYATLGSLLALTTVSVSAPVSAHHGHDIIGPVVTFIALGALLHHSHHKHHRHYSHHRHHRHHRRHSYSYGHGGYRVHGHGHKHGHRHGHKRGHKHAYQHGHKHGHRKHW